MEPNEKTSEEHNQNDEAQHVPHKRSHADEQASPIRTYSTDLAHAVRKDEMSVIKAAMNEERRRKEDEMAKSATSPKNRLYIVISILLVLGTISAIAIASYIKLNRTPDIIPSQAEIPSIIPAQTTTSIEIGGMSNDKIVELVRTTLNNVAGAEKEVVNIYMTDATSGKKEIITSQTFFPGIKSQIPSALLGSLNKNFMLGIYTLDAIQHPFLVLQTTDFQTAFTNMADWERQIYSDLYLPFNLPNNDDYFTTKFTDLIVENRDTRVIVNEEGTVILIYGFVDEKSFIVTDSLGSYKEILHRIQGVR
mgnify:FL=1